MELDGYSSLFKVRDLLEKDIEQKSVSINQINMVIESLKKDRQTILNIINNKKNKVINPEALRLVDHIISKNRLPFVFNKIEYAKVMGVCYLLPDDDKAKKDLQDLLKPIFSELDNYIEICKNNLIRLNDLIIINNNLADYLHKVLNEGIPVSGFIIKDLLNYVLHISENDMSDEEKLEVDLELSLVNLQAIRRKEALISKNETSSNSIKPLSKINFEKDNSIDIEEIEKLISLYNNIINNMDDVTKNQIFALTKLINEQEIDINILSNENKEIIEDLLSNIKASFSLDYFIKYLYLKDINDWYNYYLSSNDEYDYPQLFLATLSSVDKYDQYVENQNESVEILKEEINNILFLEDDNGMIVGINWINKDNHEYKANHYASLFRAFRTLKSIERVNVNPATEKSKGAGLPGVSGEKFRRLRKGDSRTIFIDLNNIISDVYNYYLPNNFTCYLICNFGQKAGEHDLYDSVDSDKSTKIPNLIIKFRDYINNYLEQIVNSPLSDNEKKEKIEAFLNDLITRNNNNFDEQIKTAKGYDKVLEKEVGGELRNA